MTDIFKVKEYKMVIVLEDELPHDSKEFNKQVNDYIEKGYKLYGLPFVWSDAPCVFFAQAVVLPVDESEVENG